MILKTYNLVARHFSLLKFLTPLTVGIVLALINLVNGQYLMGAVNVSTGILVMLCWVFLIEDKDSLISYVLCSFSVLILSTIFSFSKYHLFNKDAISAHVDATNIFIQAGLECKSSNADFEQTIQNGLKNCGSIDYVNAQNFLFDMQKNMYLPPTASLIDQAMNTPETSIGDPCTESLQNLLKLCPDVKFYAK